MKIDLSEDDLVLLCGLLDDAEQRKRAQVFNAQRQGHRLAADGATRDATHARCLRERLYTALDAPGA